MKVLQINTTYNFGSTGRIVAGIDRVLAGACIESYVAYGYGNLQDTHHYKIINQLDSYSHNICSRLTDGQGLFSSYKTKKLINYIDDINPDVVQLHNLHGNYLNYGILFNYLRIKDCKVVWTLHDCWAFTGHCAYFDMVGCNKWKIQCCNCPQKNAYPPSVFADCSRRNYNKKKELFLSLGKRLVLVPVSNWLSDLLKESFFAGTSIKVIHNGINLEKFKIYQKINVRPYILGVAAPWNKRKGLSDFIKLREILDPAIDIVLVGLSKQQIESLSNGIEGVEHTNSIEELAKLYSGAIAFVNTTYEDNYPTVNLEAIACGTPVITYKTGGCVESVNSDCGVVVEQGYVNDLIKAISLIRNRSFQFRSDDLRSFAESNFNEVDCFKSYLNLYKLISV